MIRPYSHAKMLPKLRAERNRLERLAVSNLSEAVAKYIEVAYKKLEKAIELLEKERKNENMVPQMPERSRNMDG